MGHWSVSSHGHTCLQHRHFVAMYVTLISIPTCRIYCSSSSLRHYQCPFRADNNSPYGQVPGVGPPKIPYFRVWPLVLLEPWAIQHQGTHSNCRYGQHRCRWYFNHGHLRGHAYHLPCEVGDWQAILPGNNLSRAGFLFCRRPPPIPRLAFEHDLAWCPCSLRVAKRHALKLQQERKKAHLKRALPLSHNSGQLPVFLDPRVSVDRPQCVQLGMLDHSQ